MTDIDCMVLSNDMQNLYICTAISPGECGFDQEFKKTKTGPVVHLRRLITAVRILRLYVTTGNLSKNLILTTYVMPLYSSISKQSLS